MTRGRKGKRQEHDPSVLTPREEVFVVKYLALDNATEAYCQVYKCPRASARTLGARLLAKVRVADAVAAGREKRLELCEIDADEAMRRLSAIAAFEPLDCFRGGKLLPLDEWPARARAAVTGWKADGEVKLGAKVPALLAIAEAGGRIKRKVDVSVGFDPVEYLASLRRPKVEGGRE